MSINSRELLGLFVLFAAGMLLALAARNLPARLLALQGDNLRATVLAGTASDADFAAFVEIRRAATGWQPRAEYFDELAAAYAARAEAPNAAADPFPGQREAAQIAALRLEPADSYGWAQLAFLDMQKAEMSKAAADLRRSIETAPYEPDLMPSRLAMKTELHDYMTPVLP